MADGQQAGVTPVQILAEYAGMGAVCGGSVGGIFGLLWNVCDLWRHGWSGPAFGFVAFTILIAAFGFGLGMGGGLMAGILYALFGGVSGGLVAGLAGGLVGALPVMSRVGDVSISSPISRQEFYLNSGITLAIAVVALSIVFNLCVAIAAQRGWRVHMKRSKVALPEPEPLRDAPLWIRLAAGSLLLAAIGFLCKVALHL